MVETIFCHSCKSSDGIVWFEMGPASLGNPWIVAKCIKCGQRVAIRAKKDFKDGIPITDMEEAE